jgi:type IV fimbrial biogenesis protein FimT
MTLCISNAVGDACVTSGDWDQGWIVMEPGGDVIKWQEPLASGIKVFELSSVHTMNFQPSGIVSTPVTITVCQNFPDEGIEERELMITTTGRHSVSTTTTGCP